MITEINTILSFNGKAGNGLRIFSKIIIIIPNSKALTPIIDAETYSFIKSLDSVAVVSQIA